MDDIRILYLDNNSFLVNQIKLRFEWKNYQVTTTANEQDFISKIRCQSYDLLIIDLQTPTPDALVFLQRFPAGNFNHPVIIVSENTDYHLITQAMQQGCIDFVFKDSLPQKFFERLRLSVFQAVGKQKSSRKKITCHTSPAKKKLLNDISASNIVHWEYFPSKDLVHLIAAENKMISTLSYREFMERIHPDDLVQVKTQNNICLFSLQPVEYNFRYFATDQQITTYHTHIDAEVDNDGVVNRLYGDFQTLFFQPISADQSSRLKLSFLDNTADAVFITDRKKQIISVNQAFTKISGYSEQAILKQQSCVLNTEKFDEQFFENVADYLKNNNFWQGETALCHRDGHSIPVWQSISILKDDSGHITQSISVLKDLSQQKANEESIQFRANHDPLTQLPNRTLFLDRLNNALKLSKRNNSKLALMLLDLDKFKWINDSFGHHAGDIVLQQTAKKLQTAVRNSDTVARLGGDEFSIIVPELEKATDAELIASKIFTEFKQPIYIDQQEVFISGSIGISIFPDDGTNNEILQKNADSAMYMAKNNGRNSYYFYTRALQLETEKRLKLINEMRSAIFNNEFSLHYQPIIDVATEKVASAETLLRWNKPQTGYIPLNNFIPVAEESGLIREIGNWVITEVADTITRWSNLGLKRLPISINQSIAQYNPVGCYLEWLNILKQKQIPSHWITFELNEKIFLDENNYHFKAIKNLHKEGIKISLDKFGSGYSSLNYLKKFPFDSIKIDRFSIHSMTNDSVNAIIVETIIMLANKLGIKVIATGVENHQQLALLKNQCRYAQGYYFSKPLPLIEFEEFLKTQNS